MCRLLVEGRMICAACLGGLKPDAGQLGAKLLTTSSPPYRQYDADHLIRCADSLVHRDDSSEPGTNRKGTSNPGAAASGESVLFLGSILGHSGRPARIGLGSRFEQNYFARLHVAELLASFLLDDAGVAALQGVDLALQVLMLLLLAIDFLLHVADLGALGFPNLHSVGAEDDLVSDQDGQQGNAESRQHAAHAVDPTSGDVNRDLHTRPD